MFNVAIQYDCMHDGRMKVYILTEQFEVEGNVVQGAYASRDKALDARDQYVRDRYDFEYNGEGSVDWTWICEDLNAFEVVEMDLE